MEIVILLVPLAVLLVVLGVAAFLWALRRGQFDDLDSPQWRVVFDDQREHPGKPDKGKDSHDAD